MTPTDFAALELELWQLTLREQKNAEDDLNEARRARRPKIVLELIPVLEALRTRADLLLAEAVKMKLSSPAVKGSMSDWSSTYPGGLQA